MRQVKKKSEWAHKCTIISTFARFLSSSHDQARCRKTGDWCTLLRYKLPGLRHETFLF